MGELVVLSWERLAREVRREMELVEPVAGPFGWSPRAPRLDELDGDTDWIQDPYSLDTE